MIKNKTSLYRFFEIVPGVLAWSTLLLTIPMAYYFPRVFAAAMIAYMVYWLFRTILIAARTLGAYRLYNRDRKIDWLKDLMALKIDRDWRDIYHLVIVPTYKEKKIILEHSIESVINSDYPNDRIIYVLATEERDRANAEEIASSLKREYGSKFFHFASTLHPKDLPNEIKGKGANIYYSAKEILKFIDSKDIPYKDVIVTTMDADNRMDPKYLPCLTYKFITDSNPADKSFQPLPMYFNNIWDVPPPMRIMAMSSAFWQMIVATQPHLLRNFSAHAQSLEGLIKVDFWSKTTIVEDGHQFWRSYFALKGRHKVVPMFTPIYMDAVLADSLWLTFKEQYLQQRRWSWGISDLPYVYTNMLKDHEISFWDKLYKAILLFDSYFNWSTASLILAVVAWYPFIFSHTFFNSIYAYSFPLVYSRLAMVAWVGMITTLVLSTLILPPCRKKYRHGWYLAREWVITPIILAFTNIIFSAIPALESQTRLMLGKYLEFRVTVKSVSRSGVK